MLSDDWHRRALRSVLDAGAASAPGTPSRRSGSDRVRLGQPDRTAGRGQRTPRRLRRRAGADPRAPRPSSRASTTSTTPATRSGCSASRCGAGPRRARCPRAATRANTWPTWPRRSRAPADGERGRRCRAARCELLLAQIKATLERYGVIYDRFFSERTLHEGSPSEIERALALLERGRPLLPLRGRDCGCGRRASATTRTGCVVRSNGEPTYLAADIAYLLEQARARLRAASSCRSASDHTAYVRAMKAAMAALGGDPDTVEMPLLQFVHLVEGGEVSRCPSAAATSSCSTTCSTRSASTRPGSSCSSDRTTARSSSTSSSRASSRRENPVYYIQYAHARIASMLRRFAVGARRGAALAADWGAVALESSERELIKKLLSFPSEVAEAACGGGRTGSPATPSSSPRTSPRSTATAGWSVPTPEAVES